MAAQGRLGLVLANGVRVNIMPNPNAKRASSIIILLHSLTHASTADMYIQAVGFNSGLAEIFRGTVGYACFLACRPRLIKLLHMNSNPAITGSSAADRANARQQYASFAAAQFVIPFTLGVAGINLASDADLLFSELKSYSSNGHQNTEVRSASCAVRHSCAWRI